MTLDQDHVHLGRGSIRNSDHVPLGVIRHSLSRTSHDQHVCPI